MKTAYGSPNRCCCPVVTHMGATGAKRPFVFNKPPKRICKRCLKPDVPFHPLSGTSLFSPPDPWANTHIQLPPVGTSPSQNRLRTSSQHRQSPALLEEILCVTFQRHLVTLG